VLLRRSEVYLKKIKTVKIFKIPSHTCTVRARAQYRAQNRRQPIKEPLYGKQYTIMHLWRI